MMAALDLKRLVPGHVLGFEAYVPSKPDAELCRLYQVPYLHRLNNNENPLGPPSSVKDVLRGLNPHVVSTYPSGDSWALRGRLAELWQVERDQIVVGNGANEVIGFVVKAFCEAGDNIVTADRTFAVAEWIARFSGVLPRLVPLLDNRFDASSMVTAIDARTKILFVCNPNNPTGTHLTADEIEDLLLQVDGRAIVVLDEAYAEYMEASDFPDSRALLERHPNLVVFRTFSKAWALAGLRIGYLVGGRDLVDAVRRTAIAYSINVIAQEAAIATLQDDGEHLHATRKLVSTSRDLILRAMQHLDVPVISHSGNFMMLKVPMGDTGVHRQLMRRGYMVRAMADFRFPGWIRLSLSTPDVMRGFVGAFSEILQHHRPWTETT
jgi:histidinol-phosphate aminotransferase